MRIVNQGFTLIELLIVLVITGLTTTLLVSGLNSTWNNFDKLLAKNLSLSSARLPAAWFERSIRGSILYHPQKVYFEGDESELTFVSNAGPSAQNKAPLPLLWQISGQKNGYALVYSTTISKAPTAVYRFATQPRFEYLVAGAWVATFKDQLGLLPSAIRIVYDDKIWAFAVPHRPIEADVPSEMPMTGKYEF
jgi:prepilin-type N-terminal cleavage/methylation domain-containing protein